MRFAALLFAYLIVIGWLLVFWPSSSPAKTESDAWRRTATGWESVEEWEVKAPLHRPLHPVLVGSLQLGVSIIALMAGDDAERRAKEAAKSEFS